MPRISWYKQERLIEYCVSGLSRISASLLGVHHKTAAYDFLRLRLRMIITYDFPRLHGTFALKLPSEGGTIEVDKL